MTCYYNHLFFNQLQNKKSYEIIITKYFQFIFIKTQKLSPKTIMSVKFQRHCVISPKNFIIFIYIYLSPEKFGYELYDKWLI